MSATARHLNTFEVTAELLRVAESGDVNELLSLLPRVNDINVGNRYGTTALMKAAFFGHEPAVRVLLERGADPNLTRNDRFTALALAAFCGHAEAVKTLIEFGAKTDVVTRAGASARTWAKARTFDDVARCLDKHAPKVVTVARAPVPVAATPIDVTPVAVKILKDPPEIWDLVHEEPRGFNPRLAFLSRLTSMRRTFAFGACAVVLLIVGCAVGALMLRSSHARVLPPEVSAASIAAETTVMSQPQPQAVVESQPVEVVNDNHARAVPNKARLLIRQPRTAPLVREIVSEAPVENVQNSEAAAVASPKFESPKPAPPAVKTSPDAALSPHLITAPKNAPPKGKVIQWP